jgi:8-oxo-dGTP diphosphatase
MGTFLGDEENQRFVGTGEVNAAGQSLREFLECYDPNRYKNPSNTVDIIIFTYGMEDGRRVLKRLLLIKRGNHPCIGFWATPGGFVEFRESLLDAAKRELEEETHISGLELAQLGSYGDYDRDPRTRIITTAYVALVEDGKIQAMADDDARDAAWFDIAVEQSDAMPGDDGLMHAECRIRLECPEKGESIGARVDKYWDDGSILRKRGYRLLEAERLSADHGAIIMEAIDYVKDYI